MSDDKQQRSAEEIQQAWNDYYKLEQDMFGFLSNEDNAKTLHFVKGMKAEYTKWKDTDAETKAPKYVRQIIKINNLVAQGDFLEMKDLVDEAFVKAVGEDEFKRFSGREAKLYKGVEQINLSFNKAFKSRSAPNSDKIFFEVCAIRGVPKSNKYLAAIYDDEFDELQDMKTTLVNAGFKAYIDGGDYCRATLFVDSSSLHNVAKKQCGKEISEFKLQVREHTGTQYIARIRTKDNDNDRAKYGLMIISHESELQKKDIFRAIPQPERNHSLAKNGIRLDFPVTTTLEIYIKD